MGPSATVLTRFDGDKIGALDCFEALPPTARM